MAKSISNPNIAVTVDTGEVKPKVSGVNKALAELSGKPLVDLKNTAEKSFDAINKDIKATVENLYRLRSEMAKGGDPSKIAKQLQGQLGKLTGGAGGGAKGSKLAGFADTADQIFGGKFDVGKGAKLGIAGIVGGLLADTLADTTGNLVKAKDAGGGFGDYTKALGDSLPIISGIVRTVENIDELWSGVRAEAAAYTKILELQSKATEGHNAALERGRKIAQDTARSIATQVAAFGASQRGGVAGQVLTIDSETNAQVGNLDAGRDAAVATINKNREAALKEQRAALAAAKTPDQRRAVESAMTLTNASADGEIKAQNAAYAAQVQVLNTIATDRKDLARGLIEDTKAVEDQLGGMAKQIATMSGDPFEAMTKSFLELKPNSDNLAAFTQQLEAYKVKVGEVEAEARKFSATKQATEIVRQGSALAGLDDKDRQLAALVESGVTDKALVAKVKVTLDDIEAKNAAKALKDQLEAIGNSVSATLARTLRERIAAEVAQIAKDQKLNPAQAKQLTEAKLNAAYAGQAAATIEGAKSPTDKLNESIDSLKEQFARGMISEAELNNGVGNSLSGYADAQRTSRPDIIEAGSAAAQQMLALNSGQAIDASRPELQIAKEQKAILGEIRDAIREGRPATVNIGG